MVEAKITLSTFVVQQHQLPQTCIHNSAIPSHLDMFQEEKGGKVVVDEPHKNGEMSHDNRGKSGGRLWWITHDKFEADPAPSCTTSSAEGVGRRGTGDAEMSVVTSPAYPAVRK